MGYGLLKVQIATTLVQAVGILTELLAAGLLYFAEKLHGAIGHRLALLQTLPRVIELCFAQHILLRGERR